MRITITTCFPHSSQQYLAKNPHGYRCHSNTGAPMPWPLEGVETKLG